MLKNDEIALVVNTVEEKRTAIQDSYQIRRAALVDQIPTYTTLAGARAAAIGMRGMRDLDALFDAGSCTSARELGAALRLDATRLPSRSTRRAGALLLFSRTRR